MLSTFFFRPPGGKKELFLVIWHGLIDPSLTCTSEGYERSCPKGMLELMATKNLQPCCYPFPLLRHNHCASSLLLHSNMCT
mmetsp:Transcript_119491/g.283676  ORF Transcript_119491/g.283676 Transcript_119491/m.283676 type:complete len:81 (+) Transcript_119491:895-1137(+)